MEALLNTAGSCGCGDREGGGEGRMGGKEECRLGLGNRITSAAYYTAYAVMVTGEGIECSQLHPSSAQLLRCVASKATDIGTNLPEGGEGERGREKGGLSTINSSLSLPPLTYQRNPKQGEIKDTWEKRIVSCTCKCTYYHSAALLS